MKEQTIIPIYMLSGMLESGKTKMICSMLADEGFSQGQKTLILCCEEGIEEYDEALVKKANAVVEVFDSPEELTSLRLKELNNRHKPERVFIEYNTMWGLERVGALKMPPRWEWVQVITMADGSTFENYMLNLRKPLTDPMKEADLILINRCGPDFNKSGWRKQLRALNPSATILFENPDGTTEDGVSDEDLPYDMKADVIEITEDQFGILYLDAMDHPERYDGRTLRMVGQAFPGVGFGFPEGFYYFGRYAMTCCANDIQPCGWPCQGKQKADVRQFIRLTARGEKITSPEGQSALLLHEISTERAAPTKEKYVSFASP